jgi:hypothetical protein
MRNPSTFVLALLLSVFALPAQTYYTAPRGYANVEGNANNTIPFWSLSATYQQVHDAIDLVNVFGGAVAITSINLRKDNSSSTAPGRTFDVQITLGNTAVSAGTVTSTFANNLGPTPQVVLPYTTLNMPTLTQVSVPNPVGWTFPFLTPFGYTPTPGNNLCWEFRITNASINTNASMDAVSRLNAEVQPNVGLGCTATGQTSPAVIGARSLSMLTGAWRNRLDRGAPSAPAVQLVGIGQQTIQLPGFCTAVEFLPLATVPGGTDGAGQWDSTLTFGPLGDLPTVDLMAQFAFIDAGLPNSLGFSNASLIRLPPNQIRNVARIYFGASGSGLGNENATTGSISLRFGLITIFGQ